MAWIVHPMHGTHVPQWVDNTAVGEWQQAMTVVPILQNAIQTQRHVKRELEHFETANQTIGRRNPNSMQRGMPTKGFFSLQDKERLRAVLPSQFAFLSFLSFFRDAWRKHSMLVNCWGDTLLIHKGGGAVTLKPNRLLTA